MARDHVRAWSQDANENVVGGAHTNQILETRMCTVEFTGGKVTELTINIITQSRECILNLRFAS